MWVRLRYLEGKKEGREEEKERRENQLIGEETGKPYPGKIRRLQEGREEGERRKKTIIINISGVGGGYQGGKGNWACKRKGRGRGEG